MNKAATFEAYLDQVSTRKDKSIKLSYVTQEMSDADAATLFSMRDQIGWLLFSPHEVKQEDIPKEPEHNFDDKKSPSQRLRAAMYIFWKESVGTGDFNLFYIQQMDKIISKYTERLNA